MATATRQARQGRGQDDRPRWVDYLEDYMATKMYGNRWMRWQEWLAEELESIPADDEILSALRFAYAQNKTRYRAGVTVEQLAIVVKWFRKAERESRYGGQAHSMRYAGAVREAQALWADMIACADTASRVDALMAASGACQSIAIAMGRRRWGDGWMLGEGDKPVKDSSALQASNYAHYADVGIETVWRRMLDAGSWVERWDALATCEKSEECQALDERAVARWGEAWVAETAKIRAAIGREIKAASRTLVNSTQAKGGES